MKNTELCLSTTLLLLGTILQPAGAQSRLPDFDPPLARRVEAADVLHGTRVEDPYRWLERLESDEVIEWTRTQDAEARDVMEPLPGRDAILRRIERIMPDERPFAAHRVGDRYYYVKARRGDDGLQWGLWVREIGSDAERLLVDAAEYGSGAGFATTPGTGSPVFSISPDGRRLAFGIVQGSSKWSEWRVRDLASGADLDDRLRGVHGTAPVVLWEADSEGLIYAAYEAPDEPDDLEQPALRDHRILRHRLGTGSSSDEVLFDSPDHPERTYWAWMSSDRRTVVVSASDASRSWISWRSLEHDDSPRELVGATEDSWSLVGGEGERLWFRTTAGAPRGRVVEIDLAHPDRPWREIVPEDPKATLSSAGHFGGRLLAYYTRDALPELEILTEGGRFVAGVQLPYHGWIRSGFIGEPALPTATFALQGTGEPDSVYELDMRTGETRMLLSPDPPFERDAYVSEQVFYESADGTRVPMTIMHRRGVKESGPAGTWLYAYGANWAAVPWYSHRFRVWLEMGGVYALANVRGGSEYGATWRLAGSGINKQTGIDDFVAAAEWLLNAGYATSDTLIANGGSASGPLAAAAVIQRPELFGAAAIDYPVLDLIRAHRFAAGATAGNWGTAEDPDEFRALLEWSPYHSLVPGTCYPPTIVAQGDQDRVASPLHSYKFAAALQHAQGCPAPVLLQVGWGYGHTVGGPEELANQLALLAHLTGVTVPANW